MTTRTGLLGQVVRDGRRWDAMSDGERMGHIAALVSLRSRTIAGYKVRWLLHHPDMQNALSAFHAEVE